MNLINWMNSTDVTTNTFSCFFLLHEFEEKTLKEKYWFNVEPAFSPDLLLLFCEEADNITDLLLVRSICKEAFLKGWLTFEEAIEFEREIRIAIRRNR